VELIEGDFLDDLEQLSTRTPPKPTPPPDESDAARRWILPPR
jgi:hypothetical protein